MDEPKPSTSYEGLDNISPNAKDLVKRLFDAVDIVQVGTFSYLSFQKFEILMKVV